MQQEKGHEKRGKDKKEKKVPDEFSKNNSA